MSENLSACRAHGCRPRNIYFLRRTWRRRKGWDFLSPRPLRGATAEWRDLDTVATISIHAPLAGCDRAGAPPGSNRTDFNPRTPCGVRHFWSIVRSISLTISIHAPLAGCDVRRTLCLYLKDSPFQSTHPLRGATGSHALFVQQGRISIHAPLAGCDVVCSLLEVVSLRFQSTRPLRGATFLVPTTMHFVRFQSTHPLRGATYFCICRDFLRGISIHAPLAGRDGRLRVDRLRDLISIHAPLAGRDRCPAQCFPHEAISIHAPLAGRDEHPSPRRLLFGKFQSTHPLRGATVLLRISILPKRLFQSTHPLRGATIKGKAGGKARIISIHAPLAGRDLTMAKFRLSTGHFNPRAPCGARRRRSTRRRPTTRFQSTRPLRGATRR